MTYCTTVLFLRVKLIVPNYLKLITNVITLPSLDKDNKVPAHNEVKVGTRKRYFDIN